MQSQALLDVRQIQRLMDALWGRGYEVIGPTVRDGAIVYDCIHQLNDLPVGWTDDQEAGRYRLKRPQDSALFGYVVGPQSWKKYLHPAEVRLFTAQRTESSFSDPAGGERSFPTLRFSRSSGMRLGRYRDSGPGAATRSLPRSDLPRAP
jgi:hypothetical protein